jgi:hypothetical protein
MLWCTAYKKNPNYLSVTLQGMMGIYEHFHANDWCDVITLKTSSPNLYLGRIPGTPLSSLSWNFVLNEDDKEALED